MATKTLTPRQKHEVQARIRARLKVLAQELLRDAERTREESYGELAGNAPDSGDESVAALIADLDQADLTRDLSEVRELDAARRRLADGTYGQCADCQAEIEYERLLANPASLRCFACQAMHEKTYAAPKTSKL